MTVADELQLNADQRATFDALDGPLRVIAGPGTGKTTTVVGMYLHLLRERGLKTSEVLLLTFSNNAARELRSRIDARFRQSYDESWVSTFHSFASRALTQFGRTRGIAPFRLMNGFEEKLLMKHVLAEMDARELPSLGSLLQSESLVNDLLWVIGILKQNLVTADQFAEKAETSGQKLADIAQIFRKYRREQDRLRFWDFRDVIAECVRFLEVDEHRLELSAKFKHVIVDEYQDVDGAQVRLLEALTSDHRPARRLAVVGDPNQSIYAFRGTQPSFIQDGWTFGGAEVHLTDNYRSYNEITDRAAQLAATYELAPVAQRAARGDAGVPLLRVLREANPNDEAAALVGEISRLLRPAPDGQRTYRAGDVAIVVRSLRRDGRAVEEALRVAGIPHEIGAAPSYASSEVVRFGVNCLLALANPADDSRLREILVSPFAGVPAADGHRLLEEADRRRRASPDALEASSLLKVLQHTCFILNRADPDRWPLLWEQQPQTRTDVEGELGVEPSQADWPSAETEEQLIREAGKADDLDASEDRDSRRPAEFGFFARISPAGRDAVHRFTWQWNLLVGFRERVSAGALAYRIMADLGADPRGDPTANRSVLGRIMATDTADETREALLGPARMFLNAAFDIVDFGRAVGGGPPDLISLVRALEQALPEYLDELDPPDADNGSVRLMTVHASKGLEFPVVFLPAMASQHFPVVSRLRSPLLSEQDQAWMESVFDNFQPPWPRSETEFQQEEARLAYVAATRAQDLLIGSWADEYGRDDAAQASVFLSTLAGADLAATEGTTPAEVLDGKIPFAEYQVRDAPLTDVRGAGESLAFAEWSPWERSVQVPGDWHGSASSLSTYLACPRKYYYSSVLRLRTRSGLAAERGSAFHRTLSRFHAPETEAGWRGDISRARTLFWQIAEEETQIYLGLVANEFDKRVERRALTKILENYWDSEFEEPATRGALPVTLATETEVGWAVSERLFVKGYIDRVIRASDGRIEVVDYKAGSPKTLGGVLGMLGMKDKPATDLQILIYLLAAREGGIKAMPEVRAEVVGLWYPKEKPFQGLETIRKTRIVVGDPSDAYPRKMNGKTLDNHYISEGELEVQRERVAATASQVLDGLYPATPRHESYTCLSTWGSGCEFAAVCPGRVQEPADWEAP